MDPVVTVAGATALMVSWQEVKERLPGSSSNLQRSFIVPVPIMPLKQYILSPLMTGWYSKRGPAVPLIVIGCQVSVRTSYIETSLRYAPPRFPPSTQWDWSVKQQLKFTINDEFVRRCDHGTVTLQRASINWISRRTWFTRSCWWRSARCIEWNPAVWGKVVLLQCVHCNGKGRLSGEHHHGIQWRYDRNW